MNIITTEVTIDLYRQNPWIEIDAKQYDNKSRHLLINLTSNGEPYTIPSGTVIRFQGTKNDGTQVMRDCPAPVNNKINVELTQQVLTVAGPMRCEIFLADSTGELRSTDFILSIQQAALSRSDIVSSNDYQSIDKIKADTLQYKKDAEAAKAAAEAAKEAAAGSANTATQQAQTAQLEAEKVQKIVAGNEAYTKQESDLKYTVAPRKEASSANGDLKLTDTDDGLSYLELEGNSEQYTNTANKNLIDLNFATDGYYVNNVNGALAVNPNYKASGYINVIPGESYFLTNASQASPGAMYNANKVYVQGVVNGLNVIPEGVKYVRISANKAIQTAASTQFEKGTQGTEIVIGAVDTPSPEYPSEVRSVGDIPKDVNGVEIRNLFNNDTVFTDRTSFGYVELGDFTDSIRYAMYKMPDNPISGLYVRLSTDITKWAVDAVDVQIIAGSKWNSTIGTQYSYKPPNGTKLYLKIAFSDASSIRMPTNEELKSLFDSMVFMVTPAAEIDEYRPYIGENNGLVKLEAAGKNMFVVSNVKPQGQATPTEIMGDTIKVSGAWYADCKIFDLKKNTNYTLSGTVLSANAVIRISLYDYTANTIIENAVNKYGGITSADFKEYSATFNTENLDLSHDYRVMLYCGNGTTNQGTTVYKNIQLEEGTIKTKYQPYRQQITWIPLKEPLRSVSVSGGYTDTVDKNGNITVRVAKRHLKDLRIGGVRVSYGYNDDTYFTAVYNNPTQNYDKSTGLGTYPNQDFTINKMLSQMFKRGYVYGGYEIMLIMGLGASPHYISTILRYDRLGLTSSATDAELGAKLTEWLASNDPIVYLGIEEGSQFIDLYKYQIPSVYIETYDQETNVRCLNKVKPSDMTLDYKIAMSSLIKRLEALEANTVEEV